MGERERENFYILLELDYDPPMIDGTKIKQALHRKKQEWTRWQDNPSKRNEALTNLGLVGDIEQVMNDPVLRAKEATDAVAIREDMLRQFEAELRILEGKGYITPREAAAIEVKYRSYAVDREKVVSTARCPISEIPLEKDEDNFGEVLDRITAKTVQRNLKLLGFTDLYEFLNEPQYSSVKKLCFSAEQKRRSAAAAGGKSSSATITQELAGICLQLFVDFDSKQKYDRFLKVGRYPALSEMIDQEFTRAKYISPESLLRLVNFGVEKYGIKVLDAEDVIRRYCAAYGIPIGEQARQITCPSCGARSDPDSAACSSCAAPLKGDCPGCGETFENGQAVCTACGFPIGQMVKAIKSIGEAENALIENNWSTARRCLDYATKYWPGHPKLETLSKRTLLIEERYATYVENIADCVGHNQYYAALDLVREAAARRIPLPAATVQHVEKVVAGVEEKVAAIQSAKKPPEFEQILSLAETVSDSMELTHLMRRFPPAPPNTLTGAVHDRGVRLSWSISESAGMKEYVVVRRQDAVPLTAYDGDILYEGPANSFVDTTALPLCEYYYSVYTRRGGAYSSTAATAGPVLIVPEIERLRILPIDMGAQLSWNYNPDIKEVAIWRKLGGDQPVAAGEGIQLENVRLDGCTDSRIKNGVDYWYYICAVYQVGGQKVYSKGICESVMPRKMLAPIENLVVARTDTDKDEYVASWQGSHFSDVLLFASPRKPTCREGEMTLLSDLVEQYRRLEPDAKQPESARFRYSWNGGLYIFPAAITGKFATVGDIRYLASVQDVQNPSYDIIDDDLFINMKWPAGLSEVVVSYRFDRYPEAPDEGGATVLRYTKEQYDFDAGVRIKEAEPALYYVSIFSVFITPEHKKVYSPGIHLAANNTSKIDVFYKFTRNRKLFAQSQLITATIQSTEPVTFPKSVIIGKVGRLPLSKQDGIPLFEIDRETRVDGTVVYEYRTNSLPENLHIRLFFNDDEQCGTLRLQPLGGLKIT